MTDSQPHGNLRGAVDLSGLVRSHQQPRNGAASPSSLITETTDANFGAVLELSKTVPVVIELYAGEPTASLATVIRSYQGKVVLATVDAQSNPQLVQAFQAAAVPTVAALLGGRPLPLYEGELAEAETRSVIDQVLQVAAQNGVTGSVPAEDAAESNAEPVEEPLPPLHQEAYDAIASGDYEAAKAAYRTAIAQDPRDALAVAGLAQVSLLGRLEGTSADALRAAAAQAPSDLDAQLAVADLDVAGGHLDDAFGRLLDLFPSLAPDARETVRTRLLEYFEIAGADDPRVHAARRRLTMLLY